MDLIIHNARVWTGDPCRPRASAVAVEGGRVAAVGGEELLPLAGPGTRVLDLGGGVLLPGLGDSHLHLGETGRALELADLTAARSPGEMGELLRRHIRATGVPEGTLVEGRGWNQDRFPKKSPPTLSELDAMAPGYPLVLSRVCQHIAAANSAAMALAGVDETTPDPPGGSILRGPDGRPAGLFCENAVNLLPGLGVPSRERVEGWLAAAAEKAASLGLAAVHSEDLRAFPGFGWREMVEAYRSLQRQGRLPVRVVEQCQFLSVEELEAFFDAGFSFGWREGNFSIGPLKIVTDGSLGARTALLSRPYADGADRGENRGMALLPWDRANALTLAAHRRGMPAVLHAIGDEALDRCLDAIQSAREACPEKNPRHGIIHCQITRPDQLRRIREMGVQVLAQPVFLEYDLHMADLRVGEELGRSSYAWRTLVESGVHLSAGSDSPIESMNPFGNLYCGVTRMDYQRAPAGGWHPWEALTLEQALSAATWENAWASGEEGERGRIAPGFAADFTAPDRDVFHIPPEELLDASAALTVVGGKIVWKKEE